MAWRPFGRRRRGLLRRMWWMGLASTLWANRRDVKRWANFVKRAVSGRERRPFADVITEAKVRATITADPILRRDEAIDDLRVDNGVVTLLTTTASWPDPRDQMVKLKQVKGITDVTAKPAPTDVRASDRPIATVGEAIGTVGGR
jgi:hypothetical protein